MSFDPSTAVLDAPTETGSSFDPSSAVLDTTPQEPNWEQLFSGVENIDKELNVPLSVKQQFNSMQGKEGIDQVKTQAINQAYIASRLPQIPVDYLHANWPAVRKAYAKTALGIDQADVTDSQLYKAIYDNGTARKIHLREEFSKASIFGKIEMLGKQYAAYGGRNAKDVWEHANTPTVTLPTAPQLPDMAGLGINNPALVAGIYNSMFKPTIEGLSSPIGLVTIPVAAELKAAAATSKAAKSALVSITGLFTALMAKSTYDSAKAAPAILSDPTATLQQKVEAVGAPVATGALTLLAGLGTVMELKTPVQQRVFAENMKGRTPAEVAELLKTEAKDPAIAPEQAAKIETVAKEFEAITEPKLEADMKAHEQMLLKLEEGKPQSATPPEAPKPAETQPAPTAPAAPVAPANPNEYFGIRNSLINEELVKMGREPLTKPEVVSQEAMIADAAKKLEADPMAAQKLVSQLEASPRPVTGPEDALLSHEVVRLSNVRDAAARAVEEARKGGDEAAIVEARLNEANASEAYQKAADVFQKVGTDNARGLAFRAILLKRDYSLAEMERQFKRTNNDTPLTPDQSAEIKALNEKITATQKAFDDYIAKQKEAAKPRKAAPDRGFLKYLSDEAAKANDRIIERQSRNVVNPNESGPVKGIVMDLQALKDYAIVGADLIARGAVELKDFSGAMVGKFGDAIKPHLEAIFQEANKQKDVLLAEASQQKDLAKIAAKKLALEKQIKTLQDKIDSGGSDATKKQGGRPSIQELEPLMQQRDVLQNELRGIDMQKQTISDLEAAIAEKQRKIDEGDLATEQQSANRPSAKEIEVLRQERDGLNKDLAKARKEAKAPTEDQRIAKEVARITKIIEEKKAKIASGDLSPESKKANRPQVQAIEDALNELEKVNQELADARKGPPRTAEELRLAAFKKRTAKSTETLNEKMAAGDFSPKEKPAPLNLDAEANRLQAENDFAKMEYQNRLEQNKYEQSTLGQKAGIQAVGFYDRARNIMTTGEFSFVLRQGKMFTLSHPIKSAQALPDAFRSLLKNPVEAHAINLKTLNDPAAAGAREAGVYLSEAGSKISKQEEFMMVNKFAKKIPVVGKVTEAFNQAAVTFMNRIRLDYWKHMKDALPENDVAGRKAIATFINESTGRGGLGKANSSAVLLGRLMFSPRYLASRIQIATGHSMWEGTMDSRRAIAKEYARTLVGWAAYMSLLELYLTAGGGDPQTGTDPQKSDFGKIMLDNTRIDTMAGISQVAVFGARTQNAAWRAMMREATPEQRKELMQGSRWSDVAFRFARSKLHPVPGAVMNLFDGTDLAGNEATLGTTAGNFAGPMTYMDIYQTLQEQDLPDGVAISLLAMLGEGVQNYEAKDKKRSR